MTLHEQHRMEILNFMTKPKAVMWTTHLEPLKYEAARSLLHDGLVDGEEINRSLSVNITGIRPEGVRYLRAQRQPYKFLYAAKPCLKWIFTAGLIGVVGYVFSLDAVKAHVSKIISHLLH